MRNNLTFMLKCCIFGLTTIFYSLSVFPWRASTINRYKNRRIELTGKPLLSWPSNYNWASIEFKLPIVAKINLSVGTARMNNFWNGKRGNFLYSTLYKIIQDLSQCFKKYKNVSFEFRSSIARKNCSLSKCVVGLFILSTRMFTQV